MKPGTDNDFEGREGQFGDPGSVLPVHAPESGLVFRHSCAILPDMARPLRVECAGGLYQVTSRGDRREAIYRDDQDRDDWLAVLGEVCSRFDRRYHVDCEMLPTVIANAPSKPRAAPAFLHLLPSVFPRRFRPLQAPEGGDGEPHIDPDPRRENLSRKRVEQPGASRPGRCPRGDGSAPHRGAIHQLCQRIGTAAPARQSPHRRTPARPEGRARPSGLHL